MKTLKISLRSSTSAAKKADPVTPEMVEAIRTWFDGDFMKGGGFGLTAEIVKQIRKFTPLSTLPKLTKIYRASMHTLNPDIPIKTYPSVLRRQVGKSFPLTKSSNTLKSWTISAKVAEQFYNGNFHNNRRGKGKYCRVLETKFNKADYVTDIDSVLKLLTPSYPEVAKHLKINYFEQREIIMWMHQPQEAIIKATYLSVGK